MCWARGTPPVCNPTMITPWRPLLRSRISCAMRLVARWTSSEDITCLRATKAPPYGGASRRSRSATGYLVAVQASLDPLHGHRCTLALRPHPLHHLLCGGCPPPIRVLVLFEAGRHAPNNPK